MNNEKLQEAGVDWEDGVRRCAGKADLYERLLGMFVQDENYARSLAAFEQRDWDELFSHVHEIKGMSSNLSMTDLNAHAAEIVSLLRARQYDAIAPVMEQMKASYAKVIDAIEA